MFDLTGKTALITGGSYGLGVVFAHALADAGADVALTAPIVFLASDEAAYVTGANLLVDGGYSSAMGANQLQVPWHLWNVPSAIGETYPGMAPLPDSINQQGLPGVHFPIPGRT